MDAMRFIFNRDPISQAGRRGFDPVSRSLSFQRFARRLEKFRGPSLLHFCSINECTVPNEHILTDLTKCSFLR